MFFAGQLVATVIGSLPIGPKIAPDSGRYISAGVSFPHLDRIQWGYAGYCAIMWIDNLLGANNWFIVALQAVVVVVAARLLWDLARSYSGHFAGLVAASLFLVNPLIATWTRYVLTEAFFYSATAVLVWGLNRWLGPKRQLTWGLFLGALGSVCMRPNGIIMIPVLLSLGALVFLSGNRFRVMVAGVVLVSVGFGVSALPTFDSGEGGAASSFLQRTARGEVLWNDSRWSIDMPSVSPDAASNFDYLRYIAEHPIDVALLGGARLGFEVIQVRPQRGDFYNFVTAVVMVLFVGAFVAGLIQLRRMALARSVVAISVPYMGVIMVTWAIQEGRFGWWFMTTWIPVVAVAVDRFLSRTSPLTFFGSCTSDMPTR